MKTQLTALLMTLVSSPAFAGSWDYGCVGTLPDKSVIRFDRGTLAILPTVLPEKFASGGLGQAGLRVFTSTDGNSGFQKEMIFKEEDGGIAKLVELKSKTLSSSDGVMPCTEGRARELMDARMLKVYKLSTPALEKPITVKLKCFEAQTTTCG